METQKNVNSRVIEVKTNIASYVQDLRTRNLNLKNLKTRLGWIFIQFYHLDGV